MSLPLLASLALFVLAVSAVVWARLGQTRPLALAERLRGATRPTVASDTLFLADPSQSPFARLGEVLTRLLPRTRVLPRSQERLAQAGFRTASALSVYLATILVLGALGVVAGAALLLGQGVWTLVGAALGGVIGILLPITVVARRREVRQRAIRDGLADMLDLLLICVEAGISLDAAIQRVGRELAHVHAPLSEELTLLGRRQAAGVPRDDALRGLWQRTGLREVRTLAANIIQSERWGTSIARVLRVNAEVIRGARRARAERRAAVASTKMLFPLALLILPALFIVIGGPVMLQLGTVFDALGR